MKLKIGAPQVKITDVQVHVIGTTWRNITVVQVITDSGLTGLGEVRMLNHTDALIGMLKEAVPNHVIGLDPFDIELLVDRFTRLDYMLPGHIAMSALATIEMACWDIQGKFLGVPAYQLLGGKVRDSVKAYANGWYRVGRTEEEFASAAAEVAGHGYLGMKFDPFGAGSFELSRYELDKSVSLVAAVREAVGPDVELFIEMHGRFTPSAAIQIAERLAPYNPSWLEEPVLPNNLKSLEKVARATHLPIAVGERMHTRAEYRELFELGVVDVIQTDITHSGGLWEAKKLAATAQVHDVLMAPHNVGGPISTAANLHLAISTVNFKIQEYFNDFADSYLSDCLPGLPPVVDGHFALPTAPGLGIELELDEMAKHPRQDVNFNLFSEGWQRRNAVRSLVPAGRQ